jgi:hypothetical protein
VEEDAGEEERAEEEPLAAQQSKASRAIEHWNKILEG